MISSTENDPWFISLDDTRGSISLYTPGERAWRILREVSDMRHEEMGTEMSHSLEAPETTSVTCPRCEGEVPSSLYCVACGCPLEIEGSAEEGIGSDELRFDLTPLKEMQAEGEPRADEAMAEPRYAAVESTVQGIDFNLEPVEKESLITAHTEALEPEAPDDGIEAPETGLQEDREPERETLQTEEPGGPDPAIEELANELLNSVYLELWSVGLLRKEGTGEEQFLRAFDAYHGRVERYIGQRDNLLDQIRDLEAHEAKAREARIELDELDIRKSLGDLHEGEYEAMAPALRWTIGRFEAEIEGRQGRIALLEDPFRLMPSGKVDEATTLAAEALELVREAEASARLSPGTAAKVRDSVNVIRGLLKEPS